MIKRGLATFLLAFSCSLADAGMDIQRQFCERHSDLRDFDSRWEPYARKWVISLDTLRSLFTGPGFILVPFTRSQRDFENYFNVRYNIGGSEEYIKFYANGTLESKETCRDVFEARCERMDNDLSLNLFIVPDGYCDTGTMSPAWIAIGKPGESENGEAEVAFAKLEKWGRRDGLISMALGKMLLALSELKARNIYDINSIYAAVHPDNTRSINVLLRNEFYIDDSGKGTERETRKIFRRKIDSVE